MTDACHNGLVEDPGHPRLYLLTDCSTLVEDPDYPNLYLIGS